MAYSSLITDYTGRGLASDRPATLNISPSALGFYYATDTKALWLWNGTGWDISGGGSISYAQVPAEVQSLPLGFIIPGKPAAGQVYHLVMAMAVTIPANLAGTVVYDGALANGNAVWTTNKISAGTASLIGTITITPAGHQTCTLSTQAAVSMAAGDVLQLVAPTTQDTQLADIGITILAEKV